MADFRTQLQSLINWNSKENGSNTPDFILAKYLEGCLAAFDEAVRSRDSWYGGAKRPGQLDQGEGKLATAKDEISSFVHDEHGPAAPDQPLAYQQPMTEEERAKWANEMRDAM